MSERTVGGMALGVLGHAKPAVKVSTPGDPARRLASVDGIESSEE
jgi:hypothetical protein